MLFSAAQYAMHKLTGSRGLFRPLCWPCPGCGQQVTDRAPAGRPVHVEHGCASGCARLAGDPAAEDRQRRDRLGVLAERVRVPVIGDGEIIAIRGGRPDFALPQSRMHVRQPPGRLVRHIPVQLYLFDVLQADGELLLSLPYTAQRERLEQLGLDTGPVRTPPWYPGGAADVQAASLAHGLEGVVGKTAGLGLPSRPAAGLDQGQEHPPRRGHHRRLETRPGPPRRHHRLAAARRARRRLAALRRARRHRLHPGHAYRPRPAAAPAAPRHQPLHHPGTPPRTPAAPTGCNPDWSARSPSPNRPPTRCCATPAGADCVPTRTPTTYARTAELPRIGSQRWSRYTTAHPAAYQDPHTRHRLNHCPLDGVTST